MDSCVMLPLNSWADQQATMGSIIGDIQCAIWRLKCRTLEYVQLSKVCTKCMVYNLFRVLWSWCITPEMGRAFTGWLQQSGQSEGRRWFLWMDTITYLTNLALTVQGNSGGAGTKVHAKRVCIRPPTIIMLFGGSVVIITRAVWRFEFEETCNDSSWKATWFQLHF